MKLEISALDCLPQLFREVDAENFRYAKAVAAGVHDTTLAAKKALRDMTEAAFKGHRLKNSWQSKDYENSLVDAAGFIYSKAPLLMRAFSDGVVIRSAKGFFLAVPTENAPKTGYNGKRISPSNFPELTMGKLRFVYRPGRVSLLVVDGVRIGKSGRVKGLTVRKATKTMGERVSLTGQATVVMFVLLPQVTLKKLIDPDAVVKREAAKAPENILRNLKG
jgi:hypothetical protein